MMKDLPHGSLHLSARRWALLLLPIAVILVSAACSESGLLPVGVARQGETLIISIDEIVKLQELRYQGTDLQHYLVTPSSNDNQLVAMRLNVHNAAATNVLMTVDEEAAELRVIDPTGSHNLIGLTPENTTNVHTVEDTHPSENRYIPFISGPIGIGDNPGLPKGHSVVGWVVFEVPKGARLKELKWDAGDTVFIR